MVPRPKKTAQTAPTMVPMIPSMPRENNGNSSYISTVAGMLSTATTSVSSGTSIMTSPAMGNMPQQNVPKKPAKPVKKNHGCEMCGKAFRDVYHLNRHKLSHSDEKPFECPICQQRFKRKDRMTYHCPLSRRRRPQALRVFCVREGLFKARPFELPCEACSFLRKAVQVSSNGKSACTSAFATKDRLRSHMIRHEGKVTCSICGKMLSAAYITSHLKTHGQTNFNSCNKDANENCNSSSATPVTVSAPNTSTMNRGNANNNNPVTIAAQMNISTNTVNITSPVSLQHPVTITGPVNIASVNIPATAPMNIAHPVAITTPMPMNIAGPLNIAMRPVDSMPFLSQVLPSSPPW
ncbi:Vascular endothelial zinc finger 1 [Oryzias melastigma]|uniref:Vascular endothelial zinc finger 1 n=1 Tax=Oryzias melastigma TaxID=30732 RepID=A0A834C344_ORYME|nr:Vascular endothelial zinc finger 1 [Oryzias melastigma]